MPAKQLYNYTVILKQRFWVKSTLIELSKMMVHNAAYVSTSYSGLHQGMWN